MDPLGFALENFDTIGAWRDKDRFAGTAIDASGKLVDGTVVSWPGRSAQRADDAAASSSCRP